MGYRSSRFRTRTRSYFFFRLGLGPGEETHDPTTSSCVSNFCVRTGIEPSFRHTGGPNPLHTGRLKGQGNPKPSNLSRNTHLGPKDSVPPKYGKDKGHRDPHTHTPPPPPFGELSCSPRGICVRGGSGRDPGSAPEGSRGLQARSGRGGGVGDRDPRGSRTRGAVRGPGEGEGG